MKPGILLTSLAAAFIGLNALPAFGQGNEAAQVIFTNSALTVIDATGAERKVKQGEFIQPGERLITPPGVVGQIKLPDGTLLSARPGTDLKLDSIVRSLGKNVLVLNEGNLRVVNVAPPKGSNPMPVDVVSPISTLQLTAGDGQAIHVKPGSKPNVEPGTYNHVQKGTATVRNDKGELLLKPLQPSLSSKLDTAPVPITALPPTLAKLEPITMPLQPTSVLIKPPLGILTPPTTISGLLPLMPSTNTPMTSFDGSSTLKASVGSTPSSGTTSIAVSPVLTPAYMLIAPTTLSTAALKPLPPPPPPPPTTITCKTCVIIKR